MANWRRIIVGDSFKLPSRDFNYYRDLALFWPFLVFSIMGTSEYFNDGNTIFLHRAAAIALLCLVFAKERLLLIGVALIAVVARGLVPMIALKAWLPLLCLTSAVAITAAVAAVKTRAGWRPSYSLPKGIHLLDLSITVLSFGGALYLSLWIHTCPPTKIF